MVEGTVGKKGQLGRILGDFDSDAVDKFEAVNSVFNLNGGATVPTVPKLSPPQTVDGSALGTVGDTRDSCSSCRSYVRMRAMREPEQLSLLSLK